MSLLAILRDTTISLKWVEAKLTSNGAATKSCSVGSDNSFASCMIRLTAVERRLTLGLAEALDDIFVDLCSSLYVRDIGKYINLAVYKYKYSYGYYSFV